MSLSPTDPGALQMPLLILWQAHGRCQGHGLGSWAWHSAQVIMRGRMRVLWPCAVDMKAHVLQWVEVMTGGGDGVGEGR